MSGSIYGKGPYGSGKYSRAPGVTNAGVVLQQSTGIQFGGELVPITPSRLAPIVVYTRMRIAGTIIRPGFHVIDQPAGMQLSGETLWQKNAAPVCMPWFFVGLPASWTVMPNSAGAMFP
jgi:hypothetical protein